MSFLPRHLQRRQFILAAAAAATSGARAQAGYPAKPLKLLVGFAPGGAVDIIARVVGQQMAGPARPGGALRVAAGERAGPVRQAHPRGAHPAGLKPSAHRI